MMGNAFSIGRVFGIELRLDYSWFIVFFLVSWSLASHYFPMVHPGWSALTYLALGLLAAGLFFGCVVAHELAHSVVSQAFGTPVRDITLFIFGGAAHITREPKSARDELLMALAGPAASLALALGFAVVWRATPAVAPPLHALTGWLAWINLVVGLFNLLPGFPLDGGRVFRAIVWRITGNLRRATWLASGIGRLMAYGFVVWGVVLIFNGSWADGVWIAFIGWFLEHAAARSYRQLAVRELLAGHTVREAMVTDCPRVPSRLTLDVLIDEVVLPSGKRCFPVEENGEFVGLLTLGRIKEVPSSRRPIVRAGDVMIPRANLPTVHANDPLVTILERMEQDEVDELPVVDDGRLVGVIARESLLNFIALREEVGAGGAAGHIAPPRLW